MKITLTALLHEAWLVWRRDHQLLIAVAGLFVFLPSLGVLLLVPDQPTLPPGIDEAAAVTNAAYQRAVADWGLHYWPWMAAAQLVMVYGQSALVALYLSGERAPVSAALLAALRRLPVLIAALLALMVPVAAVAVMFVLVPVLLPAFAVAMTLIGGRALLIMPGIHADRRRGAIAAIAQSFRLTHGHTMMLAAAVLTVFLAVQIVGWPFAAIDRWMADARNPVAFAIVDSFQAAVGALGGVAMALIQVAAWRRLSV